MPTYDYDVLVLGGGAAGLTASGLSATLGARALMIERDRLGGDCTWHGCVPSKALLQSAKIAHHVRTAADVGLLSQPVGFEFGRVMARVRRLREEIYQDADAPEHFARLGVDVRHGAARFVDPHTVEIDGPEGGRVSGRTVVVATGARPAAPPIDGLADGPYLTNETLFELDAQPRRLAVLGAGPIGTEMAQAFARLGSEVTVLDRLPRLLQHDDAEAAGVLQSVLAREGVRYVLDAALHHVAWPEGGGVRITAERGGRPVVVEADALLVAAGRRPNVEGLGLEAAGIACTGRGITVDDRCRTSQAHVYAAGDVTGRYQFTHMSEHMAKVAVTNALAKVPSTIDAAHVPWVTYTDPELAHVGRTEAALREAGTAHEVFRFPYAKLDRAVTDGATTGFIKVCARRWTGRILGATVVGARAGELISEYAVAMRHGITLRQLSDTIHPYPSYGLGARRAADQWYVRRQSPALVRALQTVFRYRGPVLRFDKDEVV